MFFSLINQLFLEDHRGAHELTRLEAGHPKSRRPDKPTKRRLESIFARRQELGEEETIRRIAHHIPDTNDDNEDDSESED